MGLARAKEARKKAEEHHKWHQWVENAVHTLRETKTVFVEKPGGREGTRVKTEGIKESRNMQNSE